MSSRLHARPKMRFSTFRKSLLFSCRKSWKMCSRLHQKHIFVVLRLSNNSNKKTMFFSKTSFYDVKIHILAGRGFQNDENDPSLVCQVSRVSARSQDESQSGLPRVPQGAPQGFQMGPKWLPNGIQSPKMISKSSRNGPKSSRVNSSTLNRTDWTGLNGLTVRIKLVTCVFVWACILVFSDTYAFQWYILIFSDTCSFSVIHTHFSDRA